MDTDSSLATVQVRAFARARELLGAELVTVAVPFGARVADVFERLREMSPEFGQFEHSMRIARNGRLADAGDAIANGDELALLPPFGGG